MEKIAINRVSRRAFVEGMALLAAGKAFAAPAGMFSNDKPELTFGAISDIHILHSKYGWKVGTTVLEKALLWYRQKNVDAVTIAGDLSEHGLIDELVMIGEAWRKIFPGNKGLNGNHVEKVFVTGNHDYEAWKYKGGFAQKLYPSPGELDRNKIAGNYGKAWEMAFGEKYEPIYMKNVRGYRFIGSHWMDGGGKQWGERLAKFVSGRKAELSDGKPFFYVQHPHLRNTVCSKYSSKVSDDGKTSAVLGVFPNAVAFSGHSHWTLSDERSIWQGGFTAVNLGSLWRAGFCRTSNAVKGYENWRTPGIRSRSGNALALDKAKAMVQYPSARNCHQGALVKVFADRIVIERVSFATGQNIGDDWVIPLGDAKNRPYDYALREKTIPAPQFPAGAKLEVKSVTAVNRGKERVKAVELSFPAANAVKDTRPYDYMIEIVDAKGEKTYRNVLAQGVELGASSPSASGPSNCVLSLSVLPEGPLVFNVQPGESFGKLGNPISAKFEG